MPAELRGHRRTLTEAEKARRDAMVELERFREAVSEVRRVEEAVARSVADRRSGTERRAVSRGPDRRR